MKSILQDDDRAEILARISRFRPDAPRHWGTMTPHEAVCHLSDSFAAALGERPARNVETLFSRSVLRFVALTTPMPWPHGVPTLPELDQRDGGTPPDVFDADLERLKRQVEVFGDRLDPATMRHPAFGRLTRGEWGRWGYRHIDHHARQFGL